MDITTPAESCNTEVSILRKAVAVERKARYADFQGKHWTFSKFMQHRAGQLCRRYPLDSKWSTIKALFQQYPNLDVATRISILQRVDELLSRESIDEELTKASVEASAQILSNDQSDDNAGNLTKHSSVERAGSFYNDYKKSALPFDSKHQNPAEVEVQFVKGVGPRMAVILQEMGIHSVADLLRHYPRRHLDFQNQLKINQLRPNMQATVLGTIKSVSAFETRQRNLGILKIVINDITGSIIVNRFVGGQSKSQLLHRYKASLPVGAMVLASGLVEQDRFSRRLILKNAELEVISETQGTAEIDSLHAGRLVPIYPLTEGIGLRYLRQIIHNALNTYACHQVDPLPEKICSKYNLVDRYTALQGIHFPDSVESKDRALKRLIFDELFAVQLLLACRRHKVDEQEGALALSVHEGHFIDRFRASLPFKLTSAQERVFREIARDLSMERPMQRLLQGDVGSGKTVVAVMTILVALENGYQGALMAPTEILAEQHYRQFQQWLTPLGLRCAILLGKQPVAQRKSILQGLLTGQIHVVIGTHALIQEPVEFKNLGLIIIDEQHRFGVMQRAKLKAKGQNPELLTMTATPIPRTLALAFHGDLDISEIDELPPGRKPIVTQVFKPSQKDKLWHLVIEELKKRHQAYIVFPLIEESEALAAKAATAEYEKLKVGAFKDFKLGLMHGKLKSQEKDEVMDEFRKGEYQVLVATTVVEVGVDVPNATVMVIEDAERFGLAQLHQLRGRVGRGCDQSYCFLVSNMRSEGIRQRLEILTNTNDGFVIAQKDLELRGPGEFLGTKQSGLPDLLLADLGRDTKTLEEARQAAIELVKEDPELHNYPLLRQEFLQSRGGQNTDIIGSG